MRNWVEANKGKRPFAAGALAFWQGASCSYGCHYGMRSTCAWAREQFAEGWLAAQRDERSIGVQQEEQGGVGFHGEVKGIRPV